ncbi:MAG TPA: carbon-nitrogen hydrolase family protein [Phycisphaerales bacterium]|nr:carbon-nitrogen hydrolase family protein [Phycisphaerales bacterium]
MNKPSMRVALISEVFHDQTGERRLRERLKEASKLGADLAVLPELPLNPWSPATQTPRDDDAEAVGGQRAKIQSAAVREAGIGLIGGAIVIDQRGIRRNTALVFDSRGALIGTYCKCHIPEEPGFWETNHYEPGHELLKVFHEFPLSVGVQICSDINRPIGSAILAAAGAGVIVAPRATEAATYERWKIVFRAIALTTGRFVLSVNRPSAEEGVLIGGPSIAVAPDGRILLETTDTVGVVELNGAEIEKAKVDYPGYLPVRAELYAAAWMQIAGMQKSHAEA